MIHTQLLQLEKSDEMSDVIMLKLDPWTGDLLYDTINAGPSRFLTIDAVTKTGKARVFGHFLTEGKPHFSNYISQNVPDMRDRALSSTSPSAVCPVGYPSLCVRACGRRQQ
jgi:hypothetical protein